MYSKAWSQILFRFKNKINKSIEAAKLTRSKISKLKKIHKIKHNLLKTIKIQITTSTNILRIITVF